MAQTVKRMPTMRETQVRSLGQKDSLEEGLATHSSIPGASLVAQMVKHLLAIHETEV